MRSIVKTVSGEAVFRWLGVLDFRSCLCCGWLDGKTFRESELPKLPLHGPRGRNDHGCRCMALPEATTWDELGIHGIPELKPEFRSARDENGKSILVPAELDYVGWFLQLSHKGRLKILGADRFAAWETGRLQFADLIVFNGNTPVRERTGGELRKVLELGP